MIFCGCFGSLSFCCVFQLLTQVTEFYDTCACVRVSISSVDPADLILSQFIRLCVSILTVTGRTGLMAITNVPFEPSV